ncbi:MAG: DUF2793 domain-containing protein [Alphaproteobacteria bacterium]|nr:DUF2793 domain-containing protein [Alphaproteobacteria bacterium]
MPQTDRLALPLIAAGQAQKDVTHNEALFRLEQLVALAVVSRSTVAPPAAPLPGDCHIVPAAGAAAWGSAAGNLMIWQGNGWQAVAPVAGQIALVRDEAIMLVHDGGWQAGWPVAGLRIGGRSLLQAAPASIAPPTGGSSVDAEARTALSALIAALQAQGLLA